MCITPFLWPLGGGDGTPSRYNDDEDSFPDPPRSEVSVSGEGDSPGMKVAKDVAVGVVANLIVEVIKGALGVSGGSGGSSS